MSAAQDTTLEPKKQAVEDGYVVYTLMYCQTAETFRYCGPIVLNRARQCPTHDQSLDRLHPSYREPLSRTQEPSLDGHPTVHIGDRTTDSATSPAGEQVTSVEVEKDENEDKSYVARLENYRVVPSVEFLPQYRSEEVYASRQEISARRRLWGCFSSWATTIDCS